MWHELALNAAHCVGSKPVFSSSTGAATGVKSTGAGASAGAASSGLASSCMRRLRTRYGHGVRVPWKARTRARPDRCCPGAELTNVQPFPGAHGAPVHEPLLLRHGATPAHQGGLLHRERPAGIEQGEEQKSAKCHHRASYGL